MNRKNQNKKFVKVENGVVTGPATTFSDDRLDWGEAQLAAHGYVEVDAAKDAEVPATKDYEFVSNVTYTISENKAIPVKNIAQRSLDEYKKWRIQQLRNNANMAVADKYTLEEQLHVAMGVYPAGATSTIKANIKGVVDQFLAKRNQINACTTHEEVKAVDITISPIA